jgi:hypothetical protein
MSVYLYNLLFSLIGPDFSVGRFTPYNAAIANPTISSQSCAWFTYELAGTPFGLGDYYAPVGVALNPANWGSPQPDTGSLQLNPGDFLMMRVASLDPNAGGYLLRFTGVFGRGTGQLLAAGAGDLQSPLQMNTPTAQSSYPRAVIDVDGSSGGNWPGPVATDKSWVNWLGAAHVAPNNAANDYTVNVGISVYVAPNTYTFGRDPRLHVGGMMKRKHDDCAA